MDRQRSYRGRPGRRLLSILLALVLMFTSSIPASADIFGVLAFISKRVMSASGTEFEVKVSYGAGVLPAGCELEVRELSSTSEEYGQYLEASKAVVDGRVVDAGFMDISLIKDGKTIEPQGDVSVEIREIGTKPEGSVNVIHFVEKDLANDNESLFEENLESDVVFEAGKASIDLKDLALVEETLPAEEKPLAELMDAREEEDAITFSTSSFSVYGIVYTVDFHWSMDGQTYEYSIPGGGFITLSAILEALCFDKSAKNVSDIVEVDAETITTEIDDDIVPLPSVQHSQVIEGFLTEVKDVSFSNPDYVWVGRVQQSCTLAQLKAANDINSVYSPILTDRQIEEINHTPLMQGEWVLISLEPFTTEESLTITTINDESISIRVTDAQLSRSVITATGETYEVVVSYGEDAGIPEGAVLEAKEIALGTEVYQGYLDQSSEILNQLDAEMAVKSGATRFFDIGIYYNGLKIEPLSPVTITIKYQDSLTVEDVSLKAIHFVDGGEPEALGLKAAKYEEDGVAYANAFTFQQASFSVTGVAVSTEISQNSKLETGKYMIVMVVNGQGKALTNAIDTVNVNFNPTTGQLSYNGEDSILWEISYSYDVNNDKDFYYKVKADVSYVQNHDRYLDLSWNNDDYSSRWMLKNDYSVVRINSNNNGTYTIKGTTDSEPVLCWSGPNEGNQNKILRWYSGSQDPVYLVKYTDVPPAPPQYNYTVKVDHQSHGTVNGTNADGVSSGETSEYVGKTNEAVNGVASHPGDITVTEADGWNFIKWTLNGQEFSGNDSKTLSSGSVPFSEDNMVLEAIFEEDATVTEEMTKEQIEAKLNAWVSQMTSDQVATSKTAKVHNYEDRIYEITLGAGSGVRRVMPSIDLTFITDVSRSMYFPATLRGAKSALNNNETLTFEQAVEDSSGVNGSSLYDLLNSNKCDKSKVYYVVGSDSSATVWAVYYADQAHNSNLGDIEANNYASEWRFVDASNYNPPDHNPPTKSTTAVGYTLPSNGAPYIAKWGKTEYWKPTLYEAVGTLKRMDYLQMAAGAASDVVYGVDPDAQIGLVTFAADVVNSGQFYALDTAGGTYDNDGNLITTAFVNALETVTLTGGTDQRDGLNAGKNLFNNKGRKDSPVPERVAILITDGAPNQSGVNWNDTIPTAATGLKRLFNTAGTQGTDPDADNYEADSITLYTLGLSMDMVGTTNSTGLQSIATGGVNGGNCFEANKGDAIVEQIKKLMRQVIHETILKGDINDTIAEVFYPVTPDGDPLHKDELINLRGERIDENSEDYQNGEYGIITYDGTNYGVRWPEQLIAYTDTGAITWDGKIYVKAKEDFLGGNTVNTNVGTDNVFKPTKYVVNNQTGNLSQANQNQLKKTYTTPYVNVDELAFTDIQTEWTVYLGTEVTPITQLKEMLKRIKVKEVVSDSTNYMITTNEAMLHGTSTDDSETFPLIDIIGEYLNGETWEKFGIYDEDEFVIPEVIEIPYSSYDQQNKGKIVISISKSGAYADYETHDTGMIGIRSETYTLTVAYIPEQEDTAKDYKTTIGGYRGDPTDTIRCTNPHIVNVFAKGVQLTKWDTFFNNKLSGAVFGLFREATDEETADTDVTTVPLNGLTGEYVQVGDTQTTDTDNEYTVTFDEIEQTDQVLYIVETTAPDGYLSIEPIPVLLTLTDSYIPVPPGTTSQTRVPESIPYNWTQTALLRLTNTASLKMTNAEGERDRTNWSEDDVAALEADSTTGLVYYAVPNQPGVELPATGGPGTVIFYTLGTLMTLIATATLVSRKRAY